MGWNTGYRIFEQTVMGAYNLGKLDKPLLEILMEPYRGTDIDSGGGSDMETVDGKNIQELVVEIITGEIMVRPTTNPEEDPQPWYDYQDELYEKFSKISRGYFGWG